MISHEQPIQTCDNAPWLISIGATFHVHHACKQILVKVITTCDLVQSLRTQCGMILRVRNLRSLSRKGCFEQGGL